MKSEQDTWSEERGTNILWYVFGLYDILWKFKYNNTYFLQEFKWQKNGLSNLKCNYFLNVQFVKKPQLQKLL